MTTPWSSIGYLTFKRTYARRLDESNPNSKTEEFPDTISRVLRASQEQLGCGFTELELDSLKDDLLSLRSSVAGRFLWQLGTSTVEKLGLASLQNCAACVVDEPIRPFTWAMDMLALGSGVGYNIQREHVNKLPPVTAKRLIVAHKDGVDADFIVPDTRQGWVALLEKTLYEFFYGGRSFTFSTHLVRPKGALIKGFGGVASGPQPLIDGIFEIVAVLSKRTGQQLRPVDCLDIMNIIGQIIVSANVRRSAQIALGDYDDIEFLRAKRWDLGTIPSWRAMSNNSVVCPDTNLLPEEFWEGYKGNGEPYGLINLELSRTCGRIGETQYPDKDVQIYNPCAEQPLANYETCALGEIYLPNISSKQQLIGTVKRLYRVVKHSLTLPCHNKETEAIVHKNMRMGIGVTGYLQATDEQRSWLADTYKELRQYDNEYSDAKGWNRSIKLTTVKPSGTLSLLPGVTPGVHPGYAKYMIRRIQIPSNSQLIQVCEAHGIPTEFRQNFDKSLDMNTMVAEFPFTYGDNVIEAKHVSAIEQLNWVRKLQTEWSDNSVSCTVYYKPEELPAIQQYLKDNYRNGIKTVSFLLHSDHGFIQAPYEEITKMEYDRRMESCKLITSVEGVEELAEISSDCVGGACPVK